VAQLANKQFGALIAIERDTSIRVYEETGVTIDGDFSVELILAIFHPKAALHDGGVIVRNGGSQPRPVFSPLVSAKRWIEASACAIAPASESQKNRTPWR
jgi:Uncharacterized conserved protein